MSEPAWVLEIRNKCSWINQYYDSLVELIHAKNYKAMVEVGVAYGFNAKNLMTHTKVNYTGVDPYLCDYDPNDAFSSDVEKFTGRKGQEALDFLHDYVQKVVSSLGGTLLRGTSKVAEQFPNESIDFVFVDGDHRYAGALFDLEQWWPKVKPNGCLCGDDYNMADVERACKDFAVKHGLTIELKRNKQNTHDLFCFFKKEKPTPSYSLPNSAGVPLDKLLHNLMGGLKNGFFIEAGANDGVDQSNTKMLEDSYGWTGLLVEPSKQAFSKLLVNRPKCFKENVALVSTDFKESSLVGDFDGHLMSSVNGKRRSQTDLVEVKAEPLSSVLDRLSVSKVDFFSLDTEGYEMEILKGLDFSRHAPKFMLIEIYNHDLLKIQGFMEQKGYQLKCNLSNYNKVTNPVWDGTHNDYFFEYQPTQRWRPACTVQYPPYKDGKLFEEYFSSYYSANQEKFPKNSMYIDVGWTNLYCNKMFSNQDYDAKALQDYLSSLPVGPNYFTVVQFDDGIKEQLPKGTRVFSSGGVGDVPLPLIYEDKQNRLIKRAASSSVKKTLLCSFVGRKTHAVRSKIFQELEKNPQFTMLDDSPMQTFEEITLLSRFALCPRGYGRNSFRLVEVMQLGAVPVYVYDDKEWLPCFQNSNYCVSVHIDQIDHLPMILSSISDSKYNEMILACQSQLNQFTMDGCSRYVCQELWPKISLCIPTYKRFEMVRNHVEIFKKSPYIDDIVIVDDASEDGKLLKEWFQGQSKIRVFQNETNLGALKNKIMAVNMAKNESVLLIDSDNDITLSMIEKLVTEIKPKWEHLGKFVLCPSRGTPHLNHGNHVPKTIVGVEDLFRYDVFFNNGNYLVQKSHYLEAARELWNTEHQAQNAFDVIYLNYFLGTNGTKFVHCLDFEYEHMVHPGSITVQTIQKAEPWFNNTFKRNVTNKCFIYEQPDDSFVLPKPKLL